MGVSVKHYCYWQITWFVCIDWTWTKCRYKTKANNQTNNGLASKRFKLTSTITTLKYISSNIIFHIYVQSQTYKRICDTKQRTKLCLEMFSRCRLSNIYHSKHKLPDVLWGSEFAVCGVALFQIERTNCTLDLPDQNLYDPRI